MMHSPVVRSPRFSPHLPLPREAPTFCARNRGVWSRKSLSDIFADKTVVVFSQTVPFTPTCAAARVIRYEELSPKFAELGVHNLICVAENDSIVLRDWEIDERADSITFVPDGGGRFLAAIGIYIASEARGWRAPSLSLLSRGGPLEQIFIDEEGQEPVADADTMLHYLRKRAA